MSWDNLRQEVVELFIPLSVFRFTQGGGYQVGKPGTLGAFDGDRPISTVCVACGKPLNQTGMKRLKKYHSKKCKNLFTRRMRRERKWK